MTERQQAFADYFIETGNQMEAAKRAGYKHPKANAHRLMENDGIKEYIRLRTLPAIQKRIATADEVMEFLTAGMNGEIKDQFGLDPSLSDRISCAKELLKRFNAITPKAEQHNDTVAAIIKAVEAVD